MKRTKKRFVSFLCFFVLLFGNVTGVYAKEQTDNVVCKEQTEAESYTQSRIQVCAQNVGETIILKEDENGTFSVTLISYDTNSNARSSVQENVATFIFQYTNILGIKSDAYKVIMTCNWNKDGVNSKINSLHGTYEIIKSGFSCEWVDSSYTEYFCWLELKATYGSSQMNTTFSATLSPVDEPVLIMDNINFS